MSRLAWLLVALLASTACAEPPNKEMDQAQGAIDAARAAGAERYAATTYKAATDALKNANDAVTLGDYRLALNHALESREQAQNAARDAAESRTRLRSEIERSMAEVAALLAQASTRLDEARRNPRIARRSLNEIAAAIARINADVQKAGEAMKAEDYISAQPAVEGIKERIEKAIADLQAAATPPPARRRR
jgi:hypothetical protein